MYFNWTIVRQICKNIQYIPCTRTAIVPTCTHTIIGTLTCMYSYNKFKLTRARGTLVSVGGEIRKGSDIYTCAFTGIRISSYLQLLRFLFKIQIYLVFDLLFVYYMWCSTPAVTNIQYLHWFFYCDKYITSRYSSIFFFVKKVVLICHQFSWRCWISTSTNLQTKLWCVFSIRFSFF